MLIRVLYSSLQREDSVQTEPRLHGISLQRNEMLQNLHGGSPFSTNDVKGPSYSWGVGGIVCCWNFLSGELRR